MEGFRVRILSDTDLGMRVGVVPPRVGGSSLIDRPPCPDVPTSRRQSPTPLSRPSGPYLRTKMVAVRHTRIHGSCPGLHSFTSCTNGPP